MSKKHTPSSDESIVEEDVLQENTQDQSESVEFEYDMDDEIVEESSMKDKLKKLRDELKAEKKQSQEYLTGWQTERASFANYKSEEEKNRKDRLGMMKTNLVSDFFPVLDSFDMAFSNKEAWESVDPAWRTGVEYIHTQFMNVLDQYGVQTIDQINVPFDPMIHDPAETIETDNESQLDVVAVIIQKGYQTGETIIRPAKVKVYKYVRATE